MPFVRNNSPPTFKLPGREAWNHSPRYGPVSFDDIRILPLVEPSDQNRLQSLLQEHHYLGRIKPVGERMLYAAVDSSGRWLAVLVFSAAAKHLKHRDRWIGWTRAQRDRRLSLTLQRLSADWQARCVHPILVVETFVDPEQFQGTVYTAQGWQVLGLTDGHGRHRRDFYVAHNKPKRLFARELVRNARRSLQAEQLKPALASVEQKAGARSYHKEAETPSLAEHFNDLPDYRSRTESYPPKALATLILLAALWDAPRGQKDLAKLARCLTQNQRRPLESAPARTFPSRPPVSRPSPASSPGWTQALSKSGCCGSKPRVRGQPAADELIAVDGKEPRHGPGDTILGAVSVPSQFLVGCARVNKPMRFLWRANSSGPWICQEGRCRWMRFTPVNGRHGNWLWNMEPTTF